MKLHHKVHVFIEWDTSSLGIQFCSSIVDECVGDFP